MGRRWTKRRCGDSGVREGKEGKKQAGVPTRDDALSSPLTFCPKEETLFSAPWETRSLATGEFPAVEAGVPAPGQLHNLGLCVPTPCTEAGPGDFQFPASGSLQGRRKGLRLSPMAGE